MRTSKPNRVELRWTTEALHLAVLDDWVGFGVAMAQDWVKA